MAVTDGVERYMGSRITAAILAWKRRRGGASGWRAMDRAFDMIAEGLTGILGISHGLGRPARSSVPSDIAVRAIRARAGLSREDFTAHRIRRRERKRSQRTGGIRAYLMVIDENPSEIRVLLRRSAAGRKAVSGTRGDPPTP
ncbi:MAG: hypothetical protein INR65_11155 [Gluconacetobacter diazotrophicus]|nr:hypothetical protein [Gluconacetobacter diazotrophicus]